MTSCGNENSVQEEACGHWEDSPHLDAFGATSGILRSWRRP